MASIHFSPSTLALHADGRESTLFQRVFCTRYGLIAGAPDDVDDDAFAGCKDLIGSIDMAAAPSWVERPQQSSAQALSLQPRTLPRALLWSAVLRCAADRHDAGAFHACDLEVAPELGDSGVADAVRACALAGLGVSGVAGAALPGHLADVLQWQRRRPWAELKNAAGDTLIAQDTPLPATARFGRRYVSHRPEALEALSVGLKLAGEAIAVELEDSSEFLGQQELELVWGADGTLTVDLLVDGAWRPLPLVVVQPGSEERNRTASQVYRQLAQWREVGSLVQVHLLEAFA